MTFESKEYCSLDCIEFLESLPVFVLAFSDTLKPLYWNREFMRATGWTKEDLTNVGNALELICPEDKYRRRLIQDFESQGRQCYKWEADINCKTGSKIRVAWSTVNIDIPSTDWDCWGIGIDITEKQHAFENLQKSDLYYSSLVNSLAACLCRWKPDTTLTFVNQAYCDLIGLPKPELLGRKWLDFLPESAREQVISQIEDSIANHESTKYAHPVNTKDKVLRWMEWHDKPIIDRNGHLLEYQSFGNDITNKRDREKLLDEASESQLQQWGMELHDSVLQKITASLFMLEVAKDTTSVETEMNDLLSKCLQLVSESYDEIQNLSRQLFPPMLSQGGLLEALEEFASHTEQIFQVCCHINMNKGIHDQASYAVFLDGKQIEAIHLFRIVQEAVRNAIKHGQATIIEIIIQISETDLEICIIDNGQGFDTSNIDIGTGLESMRHRASLLSGSLSIASVIGKGTNVRCKIPNILKK
jgi:PAS domain S-box-containing protein